MSIEVRWTWDRSAGLYDIAGEGDGVDVRVRTANLSYASELTRVLLQSSPAAFVSSPEPPELTTEQQARMDAANPPEPLDVLNVEKAP